MDRILLLDAQNYDGVETEILRTAVRGIICLDGKYLFAEEKNGLKLPGGGQEEGEDDIATLIREVREETGYTVIPESAREFGYIEEKRRSLYEDTIWHQFSRLYFCDVTGERAECEYSENELRRGMHFRACTLEEAIEINRCILDSNGWHAWDQREYRTLLLIKEHLSRQ